MKLSESSNYWMPDIAKMVHHRLVQPAKLRKSAHLSAAIGSTILRQLSDTREVTGGLRLSSSGACERQLAYGYHHTEENGHGIDATSRIAFAIGDATEGFITAAVAEVFSSVDGTVWNIGEEQETVSLAVALEPGRVAMVSGHPDGSMIVQRKSGEATESVRAILEVKSMSDYAFKKFRTSGLTKADSYYWQVQAYMAAKGFDYAYLIAFGKAATAKEAYIDEEDGSWWPLFPVHGQWIERDNECVQEIREKFRRVIKSRVPENIERPYGPNKKGRLSFPCDYCKYYKTCFPNTEEVAEESKWLQKSTKIKVYVRDEDDQ